MSDQIFGGNVFVCLFYLLGILTGFLWCRYSYNRKLRKRVGMIVDLTGLPNGAYFVRRRIPTRGLSLRMGGVLGIEAQFLYLIEPLDGFRRDEKDTKCVAGNIEIDDYTTFHKGPDSKSAVRGEDRRIPLASLTDRARKTTEPVL